MFKNLIQGILFICIVIILPILAGFIVEVITNIVTIEMIMKMAYIALVVIGIILVRGNN